MHWLAIGLTLQVGGTAWAQPPAPLSLYVAPNGNDRWSGRLPKPNAGSTDGPFATVIGARDAVRRLKAEGKLSAPVTVWLRGGRYFIDQTVSFGPDDSGTKECPITYAAYAGETPVLCGGRLITGFAPERGAIQAVTLPQAKGGAWVFRQLFVDGERQIRARCPNADPTDRYRKGFLYADKALGGFGGCVGNIHNPGDWMEYRTTVPADGEYAFWVLYGADNKQWGTTDMSGHTIVSVDGGEPVPLLNLPDTGGWGEFAWSRSATLKLTAGEHTLHWENVKGGGLNLEAFALSDDPQWQPTGTNLASPAPGKHMLVIQAEDFAKYNGKQLSVSAGGGSPTSFRYQPGNVKASWAKEPEAEVHIFQSSNCRAFKEIVKLESVDEATRTVTVSGPECTSDLRTGDRYFVESVLEELDSPGEWYLDTATGKLYYWPVGPITAKTEVIAPVVGRLIEVVGDPDKEQTVSHLRFVGLTIENTDYGPGDGCIGYGMGNQGVIHLRGATDCAVERCRFRNIGRYAVCLDRGSGNRIIGNDVTHSAEGGILLLESAGNEVSDNHIQDCGLVYKHIGGVVLEGPGAKDNLVAHNLIHDMSRYGITLKSPGPHNTVEYNELYSLDTETFDTGGIEVTQQDRDFRSGSVIRYNLVHDVIGYSSDGGRPVFLSWGIYLDSFAGGYDVNHNLVYRDHDGGIMLQGGKDNRVWNNVFVDGAGYQGYISNFAGNSTGQVLERNVFYWTSVDARLFALGALNQDVIRIDNNLYFWAAAGADVTFGDETLAQWQARGFDVHSMIADPLFVDPKTDNYALRPESPALKLGFEPIDLRGVGLLTKR